MNSAGLFVRLATVLAGAVPFKFGNVNDTYRGQVVVAGGETRQAIIKDLDAKELANELLAAALANACGLPIPPAYLAAAAPTVLAAKKGPIIRDGWRAVFASADAHTPSVAQLYAGKDAATILRFHQRLAAWDHIGDLYAFDAWIANIDRHHKNLLFSGDREVWLIDHGHSFTGPKWNREKLDPAGRYRNRLRDWLTPAMNAARRAAVTGKTAALEQRMGKLDPAKLGAENEVASILDSEDFAALVDFLRKRVSHVPGLAAAALQVDTLGL